MLQLFRENILKYCIKGNKWQISYSFVHLVEANSQTGKIA